jgi:arylsulfatase A-like enzyme
MTANYYGMISLIDHNVGRLLEALQAQQLADDTLIVYTTDHGELLGNHGLYLKGPTPYEDLMRVTLVASGPASRVTELSHNPYQRSILPRPFTTQQT